MKSDNEILDQLIHRLCVMEDHVTNLKRGGRYSDYSLVNKLNYQIDEIIEDSIRILKEKQRERNYNA